MSQPFLFEFDQSKNSRPDPKMHKQVVISEGQLGPFEINQIYEADCIDSMRQIPDDSIDIVIADPPYNLSKGGNWKWDNSVQLPGFGGNWEKVKETWDDMGLAEYFEFTLAWLQEVSRLVKPTGSMWIHGTYHNIGLINFAMQVLGIEIINEVIWYKRNSFPNLSGRRLTASHESILWAHTGGSKSREYQFNYDRSKTAFYEYDRLKQAGKQQRTVWDIPNNKIKIELSHGKHPTQKPVRLVQRMLELSASPGQIALIPFSGSGSECVAAQEMGMGFLGFEIDADYVDISRKRLGQ
jgi:site-specific DNA-methyltransferase (adenine-specific)